jgi:hypothetical protein
MAHSIVGGSALGADAVDGVQLAAWEAVDEDRG